MQSVSALKLGTKNGETARQTIVYKTFAFPCRTQVLVVQILPQLSTPKIEVRLRSQTASAMSQYNPALPWSPYETMTTLPVQWNMDTPQFEQQLVNYYKNVRPWLSRWR